MIEIRIDGRPEDEPTCPGCDELEDENQRLMESLTTAISLWA
jgi:hypothetical protein